jgi:hypothetical protein
MTADDNNSGPDDADTPVAKRRRRSDKFVEPFVMVMDDGTRFRCSVAALGRETEPRWVLIDSNGAQYIGPRVDKDKSREGVEHLIAAWWREEKAAGSATSQEKAE